MFPALLHVCQVYYSVPVQEGPCAEWGISVKKGVQEILTHYYVSR